MLEALQLSLDFVIDEVLEKVQVLSKALINLGTLDDILKDDLELIEIGTLCVCRVNLAEGPLLGLLSALIEQVRAS